MREWLIKIRKDKEMTIPEAAEASGISQTMYYYIESGERGAKLPVSTAKKIASALGFEWQRFYEEGEDEADGAERDTH